MLRAMLIAALMAPVAVMAHLGPDTTLASLHQTTPMHLALSAPPASPSLPLDVACLLPDPVDHGPLIAMECPAN